MTEANLPKLYTSRWASKDLARLSCVPVGISRGVPKWPLPYRYRMFRELAPSREVFGIEDHDEFAEAYKAQLGALGLEKIVSGLARIGEEHGGRPLVLLCFEDVLGKGDQCHRLVFARWFEERAGIEVPELSAGMIEGTFTMQEKLF